MSEKQIAVTAADLKDILKTVIEEARQPVVTERDKRELQEANEARAASVEQIKEQEAAREWTQTVGCKHRRRDNTPRTVHVNANAKSGGEFLLCQACQVVIRPTDATGKRYESGTIFDTDVFNSLVVDQSPVIW